MSYGYSQSLAHTNKTESARHIGVALGRVCIRAGISVSCVAVRFGVSRMAVYNWFSGRSVPKPELTFPIKEYIRAVKLRHNIR